MKNNIKKLIKRFRNKRESVYGPAIFHVRPWLDKEVDEQLHKRAFKLW
jgi:hypothetical protein